MQGRKTFTPKMLYGISLQALVPENNFYRRLLTVLDLHWLYKQTATYYGTEGQESIDPVVFFKICIVGYINNIASDRKLSLTVIRFCQRITTTFQNCFLEIITAFIKFTPKILYILKNFFVNLLYCH